VCVCVCLFVCVCVCVCVFAHVIGMVHKLAVRIEPGTGETD